MVQMMSRLVFGSFLLVHIVTASKYGSSSGGAGGGGGSGGGESIYLSSGGGSAGNVGGGSEGGSSLDLGSMFGMSDFAQSGPSYQSAGGASVPAAIQTKRTVEVKPVSIPQEPVEPHIVDVEATYQPVHVIFRSSSSPVMVQQIHTPAQPAKVEATQSEDQPHRVQHSVIRPVIQEVMEIIQPYRKVLQQINPVQEEVRTVVAKAENHGRSAGGGGAAAAGGDYGALVGGGAGASGGVGSGSGLGGAGAGAYASAAASVASPSYTSGTRGRRSSLTSRGVIGQRKAYRRTAMAKRTQTYAYAL